MCWVKDFENKHWSIRQGDRPSSVLFCYGIDPHLIWLDSRLKGIPIYRRPVEGPVQPTEPFPPTESEIFKVIGYIDDVKPAITSMHEFSVVDYGSSLFEKASGCVLHRNPSSGKVKFLPLGRWRGTLSQEDLPVNYILLSDHLDMIGVDLRATPSQTRKANGDILVDKVKKIIGAWKGGKFLPLSLRGLSANNYCLSKVWFKCGSIDLRQGDFASLTSQIKSWIYTDQLIKPEELVLYRERKVGGIGLLHIKYRAMAELIKTFIDTARNPKFIRNLYHQALFDWHVLDIKTIPNPGKSPYYTEEFFSIIRDVENEGILCLSRMSIADWYKVIIERNLLQQTDDNNGASNILTKCELRNPEVDWRMTWSFTTLRGIESHLQSFLLRLLHGLLPTQERVYRVFGSRYGDSNCRLCTDQVECSIQHALLTCPYNNEIGSWLLRSIKSKLPHFTLKKIICLDFGKDLGCNDVFPVTWLTANTLYVIWNARVHKKPVTFQQTRATLEAEIMLLRKTRFAEFSNTIAELVKIN